MPLTTIALFALLLVEWPRFVNHWPQDEPWTP